MRGDERTSDEIVNASAELDTRIRRCPNDVRRRGATTVFNRHFEQYESTRTETALAQRRQCEPVEPIRSKTTEEIRLGALGKRGELCGRVSVTTRGSRSHRLKCDRGSRATPLWPVRWDARRAVELVAIPTCTATIQAARGSQRNCRHVDIRIGREVGTRFRRFPVFTAAARRKCVIYSRGNKPGKLCGPQSHCRGSRGAIHFLVARHAGHARTLDEDGLGLHARRLGPQTRI